MRKTLLSAVLSLFVWAGTFAAVPFKVTTVENGEFAPGTIWYTMTIGDGSKGISDNEGAEFISLSRVTYEARDLWCFVGNDSDGYAIYNKQAGAGKVLASSTTMVNKGGGTYPTMQEAAQLPAGYVGLWDFAVSDKIAGVNGFFMKLHGTDYAVNNFGGNGKLAFWTEGKDAGSTVCITVAEAVVDILVSTGSFTASNSNGTWHSKWESTMCPGLTLSTSANNMTVSGDYIAGYSGQSGSSTYTLTAPEGLVVAGYSFDFVNTDNDGSYELTLSANGETHKSSATGSSVSVTIEEPARTATFTQSGANKGLTFSNFKVYLKPDIREPEPNFEVFPTPTSGAIPYRIPAIAKAHNGDLIAVADYRHSRADIGMATNGRIDLHARISKDNGETWGEIFSIIDGRGAAGVNTPNQMYVGFGDPCIVADRESDTILVISCSGNVSFPNGQRNNHQGIAHFYSNDGVTWTEPVDRSESIYSQFDNSPYGPVRAMFVGSGKISQSKYIKVNDFYRLYCAVLVKDVNGTHVNFVLYSDDFGGSWTVLGGTEMSPIPGGGDEPKADELPDGSVVISSRTSGGRIYNIFSYTDAVKAEGAWGTSVYSNSSNKGTIAVSNSTNGEIITVPAKRVADGKPVYLFLQSVPFGSGRANVGIYYKEFESLADFVSPEKLAADWDGRHQSSYLSSAYSTLCWQADNKLAFLYEEDTYGTSGGGYTIVYKNYTLEQITDSAYTYNQELDAVSFVAESIDVKAEGFTEGEYVGCASKEAVEALAAAIDAYKETPSYDAYEAINRTMQEGLIEVIPNAWYRLRNAERSNGTLYLKPENSRLTAGTSNISTADQLFSFVPAGDDGKYYLYNGNYEYYLGPLGNNETQPVVTTSKADAGIWSLITRPNGKSSVVCQNKTGGHSGLHLAGDNSRLVPWTNDAGASLWYIEPVEELTLTINEFAAVCMPYAMVLPEGVTAYVSGGLAKDLDGVPCIPIVEYGSNVVEGEVPVVLAAKNGEYVIGVGAEADAFEGRNAFKGVLKSASVSGRNLFTLKNGRFEKRASSSGSIKANTTYYIADTEAETLDLRSDVEASVEDVDAVKDVRFYDLKGNEVEKPLRGIYITSEGEKVLVL